VSPIIITSVLSFIGVLIVGVLVPLYLVRNAARERREDNAAVIVAAAKSAAAAAELHRQDRKDEWARQDDVAAKAAQAAADTARRQADAAAALAANQKATADQAAEAAELLLARQQESENAQQEVAAQAREAARLLAENNKMVAESAKQTGLKLDTIHTLVNSNMTAAMESERAAVAREITVMRELIELRRSMGQEPSQDTLSALDITQAKLLELDDNLAERAKTQEQVNRNIGLDVITTTSYRQGDDDTPVTKTAIEPKTGAEMIAETQGVDPPDSGPQPVGQYLDVQGAGEGEA
jgi:hypothetical protein